MDTPIGFEAVYELNIRQPLDHKDPSKGYFYQRAFLSHRSFDAPMVIATEGYSRPSNRLYELTQYLGANQVDVEHRYFGASMPDSLDYTYLNLEQATADLHHIRQLLGQLYPKAWVSTGISKGGQTTFFYRYFYP
ncbi:MAG TPA: S28 family serine protease, partial [Saprospiraceae bacterium]|nr:S28 family serine protease [Saprospiraceae bacterium]